MVRFLNRTNPFNRATYLEVEKFYRNCGDDAKADEVFLARRKRETRQIVTFGRGSYSPQSATSASPPAVGAAVPSPSPSPTSTTELHLWNMVDWLWREVLDLSVGYGVRVHRIVFIFCAIWLFNTAVFSRPDSVERPLQFVQDREPNLAAAEPGAQSQRDSTTRARPVHVPADARSALRIPAAFAGLIRAEGVSMNAQTRALPAVVKSTRQNADCKPSEEELPDGSKSLIQGGTPPSDLLPEYLTRLRGNPWPADGGTAQGEAPPWNQWDGFFMASRIQFPFVELMAENDWEPSSRTMDIFPCVTYENYASACMIVNLVLLPTIIAGLTGYMKR